MTRYFISMALPLPDEDAHERLDSDPVESISQLPEAWLSLCRAAVLEGHRGVPYWHTVAVEDDGSERSLSALEEAALVSQLEQALGGMEVRLVREEDEDG